MTNSMREIFWVDAAGKCELPAYDCDDVKSFVDELLTQCADDEQRNGILSGSIVVFENGARTTTPASDYKTAA